MALLIAAFIAALGAMALAAPASAVSSAPVDPKVFVCKYVGTPGVNESLQTGQNPISVSVNATGGTAVGSLFADAQGRSLVLAIDNGQAPTTLTCPAGSTLPPPPPVKVFVCKYVGTPGVDERLQTGQNPISVSVNATGGTAVGSSFADAQGRSFVLAIDTGQTLDRSACPAVSNKPKPPVTPPAGIPGSGAPNTGGAGDTNPANGWVALGMLAAACAVATRLRRSTSSGHSS